MWPLNWTKGPRLRYHLLHKKRTITLIGFEIFYIYFILTTTILNHNQKIITHQSKSNQMKFLSKELGVFENTNNSAGINTLREAFKEELNRLKKKGISMSFEAEVIEIAELLSTLKKNQGKLSHIAVYYGIEKVGNRSVLKLEIEGAHLNSALKFIHNKGANDRLLSSMTAANPQASSSRIEAFKRIFDQEHKADNYVRGSYLKLNKKKNDNPAEGMGFIELLENLQNEGCDLLDISLGYMHPDIPPSEEVGLTCFHLIFTGKKTSDPSFISTKTYSTFDNNSEYSGPRVSCPPFCQN